MILSAAIVKEIQFKTNEEKNTYLKSLDENKISYIILSESSDLFIVIMEQYKDYKLCESIDIAG